MTNTQTNTDNGKGQRKVTSKPKADTAKVQAGDVSWFNSYLSTWQVATMGPKPTSDMLKASLALGAPGKGKRPGVEALHIAMCLRREGCTVRQFQIAGSCGPANNHRRALRRDYGLVTETKAGSPYAFILKLTPKGVAQLKAAGVAVGGFTVDKGASEKVAPVKVAPKAAAKPKGAPKAKPVSVTAPVAQAPQGAPQAPRTVLTNDGPVTMGDGK